MANRSQICYQPYFALIGHFDHAESIRIHPDATSHEPLLKISSRFSKDCGRLRDEMTASLGKFGPQGSAAAQTARFAPHLFRPLCYAALGHTDDLALVLLDNLPLIVRMTAVNRDIDSSDVAFCPRVSSYCPPVSQARFGPEAMAKLAVMRSRTGNDYWPFWDLDQLIDDGPRFGGQRNVDWSSKESMPRTLHDSPLFVVSNLKLNTLAVLGHASLLQQAVMEAMVEHIRRTCLAFLDESGDKVHRYADPLIAASDIHNLKLVLLESQSAEDLVLLFFCSNYSIAEIVISALRILTFEDVLKNTVDQGADHPVAKTLSDGRLGRLHLRIARPGNDAVAAQRYPAAALHDIYTNHLFMTSYSTLAVAHHAMRAPAPDSAGIHGWVEAHMMIQIKPGHERQVRDRLAAAHDGIFGKGSSAHWPLPANPEQIALRMLPGLHDEIVNLTTDPGKPFQPGALVRTADVVRVLHRFFSGQDVDARLAPGDETGFLKLATSLVVPIPKIETEGGKVTHPGAEPVAAQLPKGELTPRPAPHPRHGERRFQLLRQAIEKKQFGLVEGIDFRDALRNIGCPSSLQYSLVYLYEEFLACIDDPPRCVAVLDLFDCFAALNTLLRKDGPIYFASLDDRVHRRREQAHLFQEDLLRPFLDALQNSFTLRLQRAIPRHESRDTAFNFRGGVSKFVAAMDVPLKCSLGLFRRMFGLEPAQANTPSFRQRFAGVTSVGIGQQTTAQFCWFSKKLLTETPVNTLKPDDLPIYLATFHMDVMHLYGPEQIVHFLHEFAHFYFDTFLARSAADFEEFMSAGDWEGAAGDRTQAEYVRMATAEIFAELVTHLFIFESDAGLFSKFFALDISEVQETVMEEVSPRDGSPPPWDERLALGLVEAMFRAFLVADSIQQLGDVAVRPVAEWPADHPGYRQPPEESTLEQAWTRFRSYVEEYGPFYRDFQRLWLAEPVAGIWDRCHARFSQLYSAALTANRPAWLWRSAMSVYQDFRATFFTGKDGTDADILPVDLKRLGATIAECLRDGRAFRRMNWSETASADGRAGGIDPLHVVCKLAYHYIRDIYGPIDKNRTIYLEPDEAPSPHSGPGYNPYLFHPGHVALYAVDPQARGARLVRQIACLRTLWDISSQLRARRLMDMMQLID